MGSEEKRISGEVEELHKLKDRLNQEKFIRKGPGGAG